MLGSITPLGERGRRSRWTITMTAYAVGCVVAGAAVGALVGVAGAAVEALAGAGGRWPLAALAIAAAAGLALDPGALGARLPSVRRQVNEEWMHQYRGWVYGLGFGLQLGSGLATVVTASAVYLAFLAAGLSASPPLGAAVGGAFGLFRAATALPAAAIDRPERLFSVHRRLRALERPTRRLTLAGHGLVSLGAAGLALWSGVAL